jgi:hypothetical protein
VRELGSLTLIREGLLRLINRPLEQGSDQRFDLTLLDRLGSP